MASISRRRFIQHSSFAGAVSGLSMLSSRQAMAASDKLVVAVMGCGGRGNFLAEEFGKRDDVSIKYVCDIDQRVFPRIISTVEEVTGDLPKRETDVRRILEDPDVDILIVTTPEHWHALATVWACQAGKHVYVEKPMSHSIWESRKMVEAAQKYNCVVQVGTQTRSEANAQHAREYVQSGKLGHVHAVRVVHMEYSGWVKTVTNELRNRKEDPMPDGVDYDMYCGPAPLIPYTESKWVRRMNWDFTGGTLWDDAVHQLDAARWITGKGLPNTVHTAGGLYVLQGGGREMPDTFTTTWEYDDMMMTFQGSHLTPYITKNSREQMFYNATPQALLDDPNKFPDWLFNTTRVEVYGDESMMIFGRLGGGWQAWGPDGAVAASEQGQGHELGAHIEDFIDAIRNNRKPNADVGDVHPSDVLYHLSNISYRVGHKQLEFDPKTLTFTNSPEANKLVKRTYRDPWVIPDDV